ncbi:19510_t:CDS:1, partial [Rhizophagus irregularis]
IVYGKLHGVYKKALNKALQTTSKSEQLISLLQEFADDKNDDDETDSEEFYQYDDTSDKENFDPSIPLLQNPKKRRGKGRPLGTKRFKSSCEISSSKTKTQRRCKKCGKVGHYQKNCKEQ